MLDSVRYGVKGVNYDQNYDHPFKYWLEKPLLGKNRLEICYVANVARDGLVRTKEGRFKFK